MIRSVILGAVLVGAVGGALRAQDSTPARRPIFIELRLGTTEMLGDPGRTLIGPGDAIGLTGGIRLSPMLGAWLSADYRPSNPSYLYPGPGLSPAASMYALTVGVSRPLGPPLGRWRVRPLEVGVGVGATRLSFQSSVNQVTEPPAGAQLEDPFAASLLESRHWRPTAAARLRLVLPLGRVARLSATGALAATPAGDVRLWNGQWEPTGNGNSYRASSQTWRYGSIVSVPLTFGLGAEF